MSAVLAPRPIGFHVPYHVYHPATRPAPEPAATGGLLSFDSGRTLSFAQGTRNVLVLGQTGSGKTRSAVLPCINNLLRAGFGGLILDVKGNLRGQVRALARACGRENDIIEFGSDDSACRTNLLGGLALHEIVMLMGTIAVDGIPNTENAVWAAKGGSMAGEVARVLYALSRVAPRSEFSRLLRPSLRLIHACLTDKRLAAGLFTFAVAEYGHLVQKLSISRRPDYLLRAERLLTEINANRFHIMKRHERTTDTDDQQQNWNLQRIRFRFMQLRETRGLMDRFSCVDRDAVPLDFGKLVFKENKVVLVHFSMDCGVAGDMLARLVKGMYYQAVMRHGLDLPTGSYTFLIADEFQHVMNVNSEHRLNDMDFFGLSREYHNINLIASQSVASLYAKGQSPAVDSLLANCTTKILLKNADPVTARWAGDFREDAKEMKALGRGECLIEGMDENDNTVSEQDALNNAYAAAGECLAAAGDCGSVRRRPGRNRGAAGASGLPAVMEHRLCELGATNETLKFSKQARRPGADGGARPSRSLQEERDAKLVAELRRMRAATNPDRRQANWKRGEPRRDETPGMKMSA